MAIYHSYFDITRGEPPACAASAAETIAVVERKAGHFASGMALPQRWGRLCTLALGPTGAGGVPVMSWDFMMISWDFTVIEWDFIMVSWNVDGIHSLLMSKYLWEMAIEMVSFPIGIGNFHSCANVYQRVNCHGLWR